MKTQPIPQTDLVASTLIFGCMRIGGSWEDTALSPATVESATRSVKAGLDAGYTFFDHVDIYSRGKCEQAFGEILKATPSLRDRIVLQSKCGIRPGGNPKPTDPTRYDFSYEHIVASVEGSLKRLHTDRLDILLLHRPDALMEPTEVGRAFDHLQKSGKVRYFGVSNFAWYQIDLLKAAGRGCAPGRGRRAATFANKRRSLNNSGRQFSGGRKSYDEDHATIVAEGLGGSSAGVMALEGVGRWFGGHGESDPDGQINCPGTVSGHLGLAQAI